MRCSVQNCTNDNKRTTKSHGITFHMFPKEPNLRSAWIKALGMSDWDPKDWNTVCSEHFRNEDFYKTRRGLRKIRHGALPFVGQDVADNLNAPATLRVCRICLATDSKMYNIRDYKLEHAYTDVTGMILCEEDKLPQKVCWECTSRLLAAARFKQKVMKTHDLLTGLAHTSPNITIRDIRSINRRQNQLRSTLCHQYFDPNDYHLYIKEDQVIIKAEDDDTNDYDEEVPPIAEVELIKDEKSNNELFFDECNDSFVDTDYDNEENDDGNGGENDDTGNEQNDDTGNEQNDTGNEQNDTGNEQNDDTNNEQNDDTNNEQNDGDSDNKLNEVPVKEKRTLKRKVVVKKKEKVVRQKEEEESPAATVERYKVSDVKRRSTSINIDKSIFTITSPSYEEQIAEIQKRQETSKYKSAPYKCAVCYRGFLVRDRYDAHVIKHSEQAGAYECFICKNRLTSGHALRRHITAQHTQSFSCNLCPFVTRDRGVARQHVKWHAGTKYQCPHCPSEFEKRTSYLGHIRIKHLSDFVCELCGFTFVSKNGIDVHKKMKHRLGDETVTLEGPYCETCDVRFVSEEAHDRHLKVSSRHTSEGDPNRLRNESQGLNGGKNGRAVRKVRRRPVIYRRGESDKDSMCDTGGPVSCEQCGLQLRNMHMYAHHFRFAHPDKNRTKYNNMRTPCMCDQCGRIFHSMAVLKNHMWVHTGEKRFKCDRCYKSFMQKSNLALHMKVHSATRPSYECPLCGKCFNVFNNRRRHMYTHTAVRPFKCESCCKTFSTASERSNHVKHVHLKKPWPKRARRKPDPQPSKCDDVADESED